MQSDRVAPQPGREFRCRPARRFEVGSVRVEVDAKRVWQLIGGEDVQVRAVVGAGDISRSSILRAVRSWVGSSATMTRRKRWYCLSSRSLHPCVASFETVAVVALAGCVSWT